MTNATLGPHRARKMLEVVGRALPGIWTRHSEWRERSFAADPWPEWCYAPLAVAAPVFDRPYVAAKLTALATWRMTQGIYRVDSTLLEALVHTPLSGDIPVDVLLRMPEWCVYIELPQLPTLRGNAFGVWAWIEPGSTPGAVLLNLLFDTEREIDDSMQDESMFLSCLQLKGASLATALEETFPDGENVHEWFRKSSEPVLSVLLYLCSQNADLTREGTPATPAMPLPVRTRRGGWRLFPADRQIYWDLGFRMGSALRAALAKDQLADEAAVGRRVTPHLRRAHWHTYISGPRKDTPPEMRKRDLRWVPPIAVSLPDPDHLVATIRPIT